ncbi:MAG: hypothetical protein KAW12_01310 [Candidatus Aminicenantes bacterium]|nr:hypothetical protein [Candidatus Aminicenantes bacterium]
MNVKDLFQEEVEPGLQNWINKFESPVDMLNSLEELFSDVKGQKILGKVEDKVSIEGPVFIGPGSVVHSGAVIRGPVFIGSNVSVRPLCHLRKNAYIGSNCVVGKGAHIKNSLCLNGSKIQSDTFVGDSVLGAGVRIGSGAVLANRKFNQTRVRIMDLKGRTQLTAREFLGSVLGDYVRIGANAVLSPGTIIGPFTWVGSGVILQGTYEGDLYIGLKQELDIRKKSRRKLRSGEGEYEEV